MTLTSGILTLVLVLGMRPNSAELDSLVRHALDHAKKQLLQSAKELGDTLGIPRSTRADGSWQTVPAKDWTSGFFAGSLWYMYEWSHDPDLEAAAIRWTKALESQKLNTGTHDVGFMMMSSYGHWYRVENNDTARRILLRAAQSLASRFNPKVGCTKSWDNRREWPFPVIVDNMMNLELLFWGARHGGPKSLYDMAVSHATKTMANHVRPDGSTYHVVDYDTVTGKVVKRQTHQGYADESVWARGQAWAVYGFTMAYRETGDIRFLKTAQAAADYFISHLPSDFVPYWDFRAPRIPNEVRDASAAAIASSALFELFPHVRQKESREKYRRAATDILRSLCSPAYLSEGTNSRGILNHAVGNLPKNAEVDVSLIYGDYYFIEALLRYTRISQE